MRIPLLFLFLVLAAGPGLLSAADDNCRTCHRDYEDEDGPSHKFVRDVHSLKGLGCVDCHGGDGSLGDMDEVRRVEGYRGVPTAGEVPRFCARCHSDPAYMHEHNPSLPTDQLAKYGTSVHGRRLLESKDTRVATCISCHTVHEIGDAKMPHSSTYPQNIPGTCGKCHADPEYMAGYDLSTAQVEDYVQSVHGMALMSMETVRGLARELDLALGDDFKLVLTGGDPASAGDSARYFEVLGYLERKELGAPACNDCHGNHGAAPPGVVSLSAVCGNCHALESEMFDRSPHKVAFDENDLPECETCHSNHLVMKPSDAMVGPTEPGLCVDCHDIDDGTRGLAVADSMLTAILNLLSVRREAQASLEDAVTRGMMTTDEELRIKDVDQALIQARTLVHSFSADEVTSRALAGVQVADTVKLNSLALVDEYYYRRYGLAVATLFITILAVGLYFRIRRLD
ncbi:MAG TPA: cytochrome c3 family protein [Acidobacteriota bacterium]|nr:cytochrome c3 family protein [Acidobacteriota bacterium]